MKKLNLLSLFFALCVTALHAQTRYLDEVFSQASATTTYYGNNYTVITLSQLGHTAPLPQRVDIYTPTGDTETARPLIIYLHTGNFLPTSVNGSCGGSITDSSNVEMATRLAKMGYVVAVASYRLGWRPDLPQELLKRFTLINAAYRGVQDVRSCIRYFRKTVAEAGNPYGIDPEKIVVWGQGTGGYVSLASAYLNTYNEILTTSDPTKFLIPSALSPTGYLPMVIEAYNGDINGFPPAPLTVCRVDANYAAATGFPVGDTLCTPQNVGYDSHFNLAVNMGGALGDSTWLDAGEVPLISFHVPSDFYAPCETDILNVPTLNGPEPVVEVSGSCDVQELIEINGNNSVFENIPAIVDPYRVSGFSGFRPFEGTPNASSSPWEWRAGPNPPQPSPLWDCNNNAVTSRAYIDTIIGYYAPRACYALGLQACINALVDASEAKAFEAGLKVAPVPSSAEVNFTADEMIRQINVYDLNGRLVRNINSVDHVRYTLRRDGLSNGLYIAEIRFDKGAVRKKVVFE